MVAKILMSMVLTLILIGSVATNSFATDDADVKKAVALFEKQKCNKCHTLKAPGVNVAVLPKAKDADDEEEAEADGKENKAPELPKLSKDALNPDPAVAKSTEEYLKGFLQKKIKHEGKKHKKLFKGSDAELTQLVQFIINLNKGV